MNICRSEELTLTAASDELFRIRGRTASISFLTSDRSLYSTILRGTAVTISVDGVTIFDGKVSSVPSLQPYNYTKETFTVYCDDYLTSLKYVPYLAPSLTIYDIFLAYLPTYVYQPANGIDITTTYIDLTSLTDTDLRFLLRVGFRMYWMKKPRSKG